MLPRLCSKSFKVGFSSMWTENLQMYKLGFKEAEVEIKLPKWKKQGNSRKQASTSASLTMLTPLTLDHNKLWKILQVMGVPEHLTCLLRNLYTGKEATVRTLHGTMDWFKIGKGMSQGCILSPCLFNLYAEYIIWNTKLNESQAGIKIVKRNTLKTSDMQMIPI